MIEIKNLKKSFGELEVLKGIDLQRSCCNYWTFRFRQVNFAALYKFS